MPEQNKDDILRDTKVEEIYQDYKDGLITRGTMNRVIREKAHLRSQDELSKFGYIGAIYDKTLEHVQQAWDDFIKGFDNGTHKVAAYDDTMGRLMWMNFKIASAPFTAFGEVNGAEAEKIALGKGASPGLARAIGVTTEIGSGFLPTRAMARGLTKGVEEAGGLGAWTAKSGKLGDKQAMEAQLRVKEADLMIKREEATAAKNVIDKTIEEALNADGIAIENIVSKAADGTETGRAVVKAIDPLNRGKRAKLPVPAEIATGLDILKATIPRFGPTPTTQEFEQLRKLARGALKDGTQDSETSFAKYMAGLFSPQGPEKLNYSKQMVGLLKEWAPEVMATGDIRGAMKILAEDISVLSVKQLSGGANLGLVQLARQNQGFFAGMREVYTNMLLPFSAATAFIGNSVAASTAIAERFAMSPTQAFYLTKGMTLAAGDGMRAFGNAFRAIPNPNTGRFSWPITGPIPGKIGRIIRKPTETVVGMDNFFTALFTRGSYYASAARDGMEQGLRGANLGQHIRQLVQNPTGQMKLDAGIFSKENTFQNQLGPLARELQSIMHTNIPGTNLRPGQLYFPFMKSAINLVKFGWDRTPGLQLLSNRLWSDMAAGGARGDAAAARLIMGNLMGMYFHEMAKEGFITGSGPVDPHLREAWLLQNEPHSIKLGDGKFISNKFLEPFSEVMDIIADLTMIADQLDDMTFQQGAHAVTYALISNFGSNSWWQQGSQMANIIQGDLSYDNAMKIVMAPVVSVAHVGAIGTRVTKFIDPAVRDARTWVDQIWANIPGYSKTIPKMRDVFGDPLKVKQPLISSWFGFLGQNWPVYTDLSDAPDYKKKVAQLGVKIDKFPNTIGAGPVESPADIKEHTPGEVQPMSRLTNDEKDQWQENTQKILVHPKFGIEKQLEDPMFTNPNVDQRLPVAGQRAAVQGMLTDARNAGKDMLLMDNKDLAKKIFTNQASAEIKQLPLGQRAQAQQTMDYGLSLFDKLSPDELLNIMKWGDLSTDEGTPDESGLSVRVAPAATE